MTRFRPSLLLLLSGLVAAQSGPRSLAVLPFTGLGVDSVSALVVSGALSDELLRSGKVRVMERSQIQSVLGEQGFQQSGVCDGSECAVRAGKMLAVQEVVVGNIGRLGDAYSLSARIVDVQTGTVVRSARKMQQGAIDAVVAFALPHLAAELLGSEAPQLVSPPLATRRSATDSTRASHPALGDPWVDRHIGFHPRVELVVGYSSMLESPLGARVGAEWNGFGGAIGLSPTFPIFWKESELGMPRLVPALTAYYAWKYLQFELTYGDVEFQDHWNCMGVSSSCTDDTKIATYSANARFDVGEPGGLSLFLGAGAIRYWHSPAQHEQQTGTIPMLDFGLVFSN